MISIQILQGFCDLISSIWDNAFRRNRICVNIGIIRETVKNNTKIYWLGRLQYYPTVDISDNYVVRTLISCNEDRVLLLSELCRIMYIETSYILCFSLYIGRSCVI